MRTPLRKLSLEVPLRIIDLIADTLARTPIAHTLTKLTVEVEDMSAYAAISAMLSIFPGLQSLSVDVKSFDTDYYFYELFHSMDSDERHGACPISSLWSRADAFGL